MPVVLNVLVLRDKAERAVGLRALCAPPDGRTSLPVLFRRPASFEEPAGTGELEGCISACEILIPIFEGRVIVDGPRGVGFSRAGLFLINSSSSSD